MSEKDGNNFRYAHEVLKVLFRKIVPQEYKEYSRMFSGWEGIAGEETAFHVKPKDLIKGTFLLETDHPGWKQRILFRKEELLRKLKQKYPHLGIKKIRVVLKKENTLKTPPPASPPRQSPSSSPLPREPSFQKLLNRMKGYAQEKKGENGS